MKRPIASVKVIYAGHTAECIDPNMSNMKKQQKNNRIK